MHLGSAQVVQGRPSRYAPKPPRPDQFVERDWRRAEQSDDPFARNLGLVAGAVRRSAHVVEFVAGPRSRRRLRIDPVQSLFPPKRLRQARRSPRAWRQNRSSALARAPSARRPRRADRRPLLQEIVGPLGARIEGRAGHGEDLTVLLEREPRGDERARASRRLDHHDA